jgi:hypothetical protein
MIGRGGDCSFGIKSKFLNCSFRNIDVRHGTIEHSVSFENCVFSGNFEAENYYNVYGKKRAFWRNFISVWDLLFQTYKPVKFINCDFTELNVKGLNVDNDVIFKDCKGVENLTNHS